MSSGTFLFIIVGSCVAILIAALITALINPRSLKEDVDALREALERLRKEGEEEDIGKERRETNEMDS